MFVRIGLMTALVLAASPAGAADQLAARGCEHVSTNAMQPSANERRFITPEPQSGALESYILVPNPDPAGDISNARGLNSHDRLLAQYALYASIGNRDGMQIISDQLRRFGVTRGEIEDFADRAKLHTRSLLQRHRTDSETSPTGAIGKHERSSAGLR
jgi:hypothetical protein